ncbi:MAG: gliding motility-associated C-terminal domain-containing protein, partial [Bacteroidales bacterium]|nr:gliding motility-associated C-terminal domain-containing protein [Bacteroidales bacterium]
PVAHLDNPHSATPIASPNTSMWFYVTASDTLGGSIYDSLFISVLNCNPTINDTTICTGADIIIGNGNPLYKSWIWTPSTFLNNQTIAQPTASPTYNITYYVSAVDSFGNIDDDTVSINVIDCDTIGAPELFIPNAFTPNTDGINDVFIYGNHELFTDIKTLIYNQWGELIFSSNIYIPWSGKFKGEFVQNGMYIYYITAVLKSTGKQQVYKGNVMVLY